MQNISRVFVSVHLPGLNSSVLQRCVCFRVSVRYLIEYVLESMSEQVFSNEEKRVWRGRTQHASVCQCRCVNAVAKNSP